jgi:hypothetical protein
MNEVESNLEPGTAADAALAPDAPGGAVPGGEAAIEQRLEELGAELLAKTESEQELLARLRQTLIDSDPLVDPELVQGASIAELEESFAKAQAIAERLKGIVLQQGVTRVPAGAPGRTRRPFLSSFEKIREGLKARP